MCNGRAQLPPSSGFTIQLLSAASSQVVILGPAIVLGHVDGDKKPGIFYRLKDLTPGDEIDIERSDGQKLKFVVDHKDEVPKEQFPTEAVYGNTDKPQLRLITCGGAFDHAVHSYKDNIIVYANLA